MTEGLVAKEKEKLQKKEALMEKVDETIESVCEKVRGNDLEPAEYVDAVKALAELVEARAKLG